MSITSPSRQVGAQPLLAFSSPMQPLLLLLSYYCIPPEPLLHEKAVAASVVGREKRGDDEDERE
jgi:hypothetical protein